MTRTVWFFASLLCVFPAAQALSDDAVSKADDSSAINELIQTHCVACHSTDDASGDVDLEALDAKPKWLDQPQTLVRVLEAIDSAAMPPDSEDPLQAEERILSVETLRGWLREASHSAQPLPTPVRRMNRFQYNNTVRDLFELDRDVFALPEKLMTRYDDYLSNTDGSPGTIPATVTVASHALNPQSGMREVKPFPKDLRAEHGFDNQADQLTLSPLLLDAYLRLSVSIVESPDFNDQTVGVWNRWFAPPADDADPQQAFRQRLAELLRRAFRGPVNTQTLDRYTQYAMSKFQQGHSFTESMRKVAAAALSSPLFLLRTSSGDDELAPYELASRLSYFLWSSCPDDELLDLARQGQLTDSEVLNQTVTRMLADPKIERFLDSFPAQWMQLENLLAVTPDPEINPYFHLDPEAPASLQMILEPLLLFDTVFVEDRPLRDLLAPPFSYRSDFLQTWYSSPLQPPPVDVEKLTEENQRLDTKRAELRTALDELNQQLDSLLEPVRRDLLAKRQKQEPQTQQIDLQPIADWKFDGDLNDSKGFMNLQAVGDIEFKDGQVVLDGSFLKSEPTPVDLSAKSLEVCFRLTNLDQPGGGLMGLQRRDGVFDTIVLGERKPRFWIAGSELFARTQDIPESFAETETNDLLHLVMTYEADGTTRLYRNGQPYGKPYTAGPAPFPMDPVTVLFGLRHLPAGGNRFLSVAIDRARLYDRALAADEAELAANQLLNLIPTSELVAALNEDQQAERERLIKQITANKTELLELPENTDIEQTIRRTRLEYETHLKQQLRSREFKRVDLADNRYGGIVTNAAMLSMTSGPRRTHPVARGVWVIEVIFNNPPPPPPNDVPPLDEDAAAEDLTIREKFAAHRENPSCAGCHSKLDPLGFALENFDITGRWRDSYDNGRPVDASGTLVKKHSFETVDEFRESLLLEETRFAKAVTEHLMRFALARELEPTETLVVDDILQTNQPAGYPLQSLLRSIVLSPPFREGS